MTGLVSADVFLCFEKKISNISGSKEEKSLFTIQSASGYTVNTGTVSSIIYAIDKLYSLRERDGFLPLIACSIRSVLKYRKISYLEHIGFYFRRSKLKFSHPKLIRK